MNAIMIGLALYGLVTLAATAVLIAIFWLSARRREEPDPEEETAIEEGSRAGAVTRAIVWCCIWLFGAWAVWTARWHRLRRRFCWKVQCAWCGKVIQRPWLPVRRPRVSHGMCFDCFERERSALREELREVPCQH